MNNKNLEEIKKRKLDKCFFCVYCVESTIFMDSGNNNVNPKTIYLFYGCNIQGKRRFINSITDNFHNVAEWYDFFQSFKQRGIECILYSVIPDNKLIKDALSLAFVSTEIIYTIFSAYNVITKYFSNSYSSKAIHSLKNIFLAEDLIHFNTNLQFFNDNFSTPFISDLLKKDFKKAKDNFKYPFLLRKHILAYYFLRDNTKQLTIISHRKTFSSLDEFLNECLPIFQSFETKLYCSKNEWVNLLNLIYTDKKELISCYL